MDFRVLEGAAKGFNQGVQNLARIKEAGIRLKMDQEKFEIDKKISNLQLQKVEQDLDPEMFEMRKKALGFETKIKEQEFGLNELKIKEAQKKENAKIGEYIPLINQFSVENPNLDFTLDKDFNLSVTTKKKDLGFNELRARESALKIATDELGNFDDAKFEKAMKMLNPEPTNLGSAKPTASGMVRMIGPDGNPYDIPSTNVEKARAKGFK